MKLIRNFFLYCYLNLFLLSVILIFAFYDRSQVLVSIGKYRCGGACLPVRQNQGSAKFKKNSPVRSAQNFTWFGPVRPGTDHDFNNILLILNFKKMWLDTIALIIFLEYKIERAYLHRIHQIQNVKFRLAAVE